MNFLKLGKSVSQSQYVSTTGGGVGGVGQFVVVVVGHIGQVVGGGGVGHVVIVVAGHVTGGGHVTVGGHVVGVGQSHLEVGGVVHGGGGRYVKSGVRGGLHSGGRYAKSVPFFGNRQQLGLSAPFSI